MGSLVAEESFHVGEELVEVVGDFHFLVDLGGVRIEFVDFFFEAVFLV